MFGVNLSGAEFGKGSRYGYDYIYPSAKSLEYYAGKGVDFVRLPFRWERIQPELNGELNSAELNRIKNFLTNADNAGLKVILDVHNYAGYNGIKLGTDGLPVSAFTDLWARLATELKDHPAVMGYDLMNEPTGIVNSSIVWPAAAQAAIDTIRTIDTETTIYVQGTNWSGAHTWAKHNSNFMLNDPSDNLIYQAHLYFDKDASGDYSMSFDNEKAYEDIGVVRVQPFLDWLEANNLKGMIGEYSVPDNDPRWQIVMDKFLAELAEHDIPSAYWGAGPWWGGYPMSIEPEKGVDSIQMGILQKHIAAYQEKLAAQEQAMDAPESIAPDNDDDIVLSDDGDNILYGDDSILTLPSAAKIFQDTVIVPELKDKHNINKHGALGQAMLGVASGNLAVEGDATATITFRKGYAASKNSLGAFAVLEDGTIASGTMLWTNLKNIKVDKTYNIDLPIGEDGGAFGFFMIADGSTANGGYKGLAMAGTGNISFIYHYGMADQRGAKITDDGKSISTVYDDGATLRILQGEVFFTTDRGGNANLNADGQHHVISGLLDGTEGEGDALRIGFEGKSVKSDWDYEDVLFDLNVTHLPSRDSSGGNDILDGGAGNDILYGEGGDDIFIIGDGRDQAHGGAGADIFAVTAIDGLTDIIHDFRTAEGDRIDISQVLEGYDPLADDINAFVQLVQKNGGMELQINQDGMGGDFTTAAMIYGDTDETLAALIMQGQLITG